MPKVLENVREKIIAAAKEILISDEAFSIRALSGKAGIAIGTIYNYFPTKEAVTAAVMSEDWQKTLRQMDSAVENADSFNEGCLALYTELRAFIRLFESVWMAYGRGSRYESARNSFHRRFRAMIIERLEKLFLKFRKNCPPDLLPVFAEILIISAIGSDLSLDSYLAFVSLL